MSKPKGSNATLLNAASFTAGMVLFAIFYGPFLLIPGNFGIVDHDFFLAWQLAVNDALRHGELLHWFHHMCGGVPGLANPQSGALSPLNVFGLIMGPVAQFKIELVIHGALGLIGFLYFCHLKKIPAYYALFGFMIWAGNGLVATRVLHGQTTYYPLLVLPLFVALLFATNKARAWLIGSLLFVFVLYEDGFHVFIYNYPLLGILALGMAYQRRDAAPVIALTLWAIIGIILALPRLLPTIELLQHFPRLVPNKEFIGVIDLLSVLVNGNLFEIYSATSEGQQDVHWVGYIAYVGFIPLILTAGFFLFARDKDWIPWLVAMLMSFALALGHLSDWAPWSILHQLPVAEQVRAPFKFVSFLLLSLAFLSILGAHGISQLLHKRFTGTSKSAWLAPTTATLLLIVLTADLNRAHQPLFVQAFNQYQESYQSIDRSNPFDAHDFNDHVMFSAVANNLGVINCYDPIKPRNEAKPDAPLAQVTVGSGHADASISPNKIHVNATIESDTGAKILINQNDHPNWIVTRGEGVLIRNPDIGLLMLQLPKGASETQLTYQPEVFHASLWLTIILAALLSGFALWLSRKD